MNSFTIALLAGALIPALSEGIEISKAIRTRSTFDKELSQTAFKLCPFYEKVLTLNDQLKNFQKMCLAAETTPQTLALIKATSAVLAAEQDIILANLLAEQLILKKKWNVDSATIWRPAQISCGATSPLKGLEGILLFVYNDIAGMNIREAKQRILWRFESASVRSFQ